MDKNTEELKRLYKRLHDLDEEYEKNKGKRFIITLLLFVAARMFVLCAIDKPNTAEEFFSRLILAAVLGIIECFICLYGFLYLFTQSNNENARLKYIKDEIAKLENENKRWEEYH